MWHRWRAPTFPHCISFSFLFHSAHSAISVKEEIQTHFDLDCDLASKARFFCKLCMVGMVITMFFYDGVDDVNAASVGDAFSARLF